MMQISSFGPLGMLGTSAQKREWQGDEGMRANTAMDATECRQPGTDRLRNSRRLRRWSFSEWYSNVSPELWLSIYSLVRCRSQSHCIFCLPFPIFHLTSHRHPHPMLTLSTVHHVWPRAASGQFTFPLDTDAIRFFIASLQWPSQSDPEFTDSHLSVVLRV